MALALVCLSACDNNSPPTSTATPATPATTTTVSKPSTSLDKAALAKRYAGRELQVADVSEVQMDGASTLLLTFNLPLDPEQPFAERLHLMDTISGKVDGAWELSDNLMELRLRHLQPERKLVLTVDPGLLAITGTQLEKESVTRLATQRQGSSLGFASRGSLLPSRLAEGLPVLALNVDKVDVDFFRIKEGSLAKFLAYWRQQSSGSLSYYSADDLLPMTELVYSGRFNFKLAPNTRETMLLPIADIKTLQQPGVYLAVMKQSGTLNYQQPATLFTLSDLGVSAHRYHDRLAVFSQALEGGAAQADVQLQLLDAKGQILAEGKTDAKGYANLPWSEKGQELIARKADQTTVLQVSGGALDLAEFDIAGNSATPLQFFVFGPRDLYRPGETVLLNGLLRDADGRAVKPQPIPVEVRRPDDVVSRKFVWAPVAGENGFYQYQLPLGADVPTGRWQLIFDMGNGYRQSYEFLVEEFLPERMALELKGSDKPLQSEDAASFSVTGRYLYGAPASGNLLTGQVYIRPLREVAGLPDFQFGSITDDTLNQTLELEDQSLDANGKLQLEIDNQWSEIKSPIKLILQASLQETGGRSVTRALVQPVWPAERLPGVRALFKGENVDSDSLPEFEFVLADAAGNKLAADDLRVRFIRERRDYYWNYSDDDGWSSKYNEKFITMNEEKLQIAAGSTAKLSFPVDWGSYRVEVEDPQTGAVSSLRFWAGYTWQDNANGGAVRPDQIKLALDKPAYSEGSVAKVTVTPPAAGSGYLLVDSIEGPLWWQAIDVPAEGKAFEIPLDKSWVRHDLYVSALVIRPGDRKANVTPKRAVGVLHLPLQREQRKLALTLSAPEKMRPNQPLQVKIKANKADGQIPSKVQVLLSAVDVGILNITDYQTPDPFANFFGRKGYGVDQFDVYNQLIEAGQGRLASLAFGGDAVAAGGKRPPSTVKLLAQQSQAITLNEQGEGLISLDIPDFNGELRLMAQAWNDADYGMAEAKTLVAAPLVTELATPRFLAGGDSSQLALDLSNLSGQEQHLQVALEAEGQLQLSGPAEQQLTLANGQRLTLHIPVQASEGYGSGKIKVRVNGVQLPNEEIAPLQREWTLGVRPAYPALRETYSVALSPDQQWELPAQALSPLDPRSRQAFLNLSSRPPLNLGEHIRALEAYPYGCAEQTVSGLYPSLYADVQTLQRLGIKAESKDKRDSKIELGIERLLGMQRYNGGFGLWSADSQEEYWLTVYVTDFLQRARERGFTVPDEALKKANQRLLSYLQDSREIDGSYTSNPSAARFAVQAYAGYVLARSQQAPLGELRSLFAQRSTAASGLPLVQLSVALRLMGDQPRSDTALSEGLNFKLETRRDFWLSDYGSPVRDQALILQLLEEHDLVKDQRMQRLLELSKELKNQRWLSTQESNALFLAGRATLGKSETPWKAQLSIAGKTQQLGGDQALNLALDGQGLAVPLTVHNQSDDTLYQELVISGYPLEKPKAQGENFSVHREYLDVQGKPLDLGNLKSGELVLVHLSVSSQKDVADALLVDLLPAGLELENQNLANSAASLKNVSEDVRKWQGAMQEMSIQHQEYRDDRYVAALSISTGYTVHLLYLARAVTPGVYRVPPPQVESMYRPAWRALGDAPEQLRVKDR